MKTKKVELQTGVVIKFDYNGNIKSLNSPYLIDKNYSKKLNT